MLFNLVYVESIYIQYTSEYYYIITRFICLTLFSDCTQAYNLNQNLIVIAIVSTNTK